MADKPTYVFGVMEIICKVRSLVYPFLALTFFFLTYVTEDTVKYMCVRL